MCDKVLYLCTLQIETSNEDSTLADPNHGIPKNYGILQ